MTEAPDLLTEIKAAAARLRIAPTTLCARAVGNGRLPIRLAAGCSTTLKTASRVRQWINEHAPATTEAA